MDTIRRAFAAKLEQNRDLARKLLETGDAMLYEDSPGDPFWGAKGENYIGKAVMEVRESLRKKSETS